MTSEKYIKITGYNGWIGSRIINEIGGVGIDADIRDKEALRPFFKKGDIIVHCAGKKYDATREEFFSINAEGTKNVAELCLENDCALIHLGTAYRREDYGESKQLAQKYIEELKGLRAVVLKLCSIVDKDRIEIDGRGKIIRYPIKRLIEDIKRIIDEGIKEYKEINYEKPTHIH
jgi:nucleoside-diphosphate-sugar epimerase